jgi:hypothetical protein
MGMKYIIYEIAPLDKSILYSYIGSTKNFRRRKCDHKTNCYNENNTKKFNYPLYSFIRENGGFDAFEMNPIEEIVVESKTQARIREQFWKENRETKFQMLNAWNPYSDLTDNERYKIYYQENKEQIQKQRNTKNTCPCGGKYTTTGKTQHFKSLKHQAYVQANSTPPTQLIN